MGDAEVEEFAVVEITETKFGGPSSVYDSKMGPLNKNELCETCECNWDECPGHFGFIRLNAKFPHPLRSKNILEYLSIFCNQDSINCKFPAIFPIGTTTESKFFLESSFIVE
jgi:DNA-directed RNA polymerase beta' subunit